MHTRSVHPDAQYCLPFLFTTALFHTDRQASEANFSIHSQLHLTKKINLI